MFADGPTRVLRFADVQNVGAEEAQQSILDLAARLKQVEEELWRVNARFSALHGASGIRELDLYGRAPTAGAAGQLQSDGAAQAVLPSQVPFLPPEMTAMHLHLQEFQPSSTRVTHLVLKACLF